MMRNLSLGFLINPFAGVGGPAAYKGSDSQEMQSQAAEGLLEWRAEGRAFTFWQSLAGAVDNLEVISVPGNMGEAVLKKANIPHKLLWCDLDFPSSAKDTELATKALVNYGVDIFVFVGGDGTARDICNVVGTRQLVLGVPAGVKMHSGVFAICPKAAAEIMRLMLSGQQVGVEEQEVRDIDEVAFRNGQVKSKHFGFMKVPALPQYVQHVKQGGREVEELVLLDIAAEIRERMSDMEEDCMFVFGPGSTTQFIQQEIQSPGTLLGVDVVHNASLALRDANAKELNSLVSRHLSTEDNCVKLIITAIGGQGHIIGRGNQQLSPETLALIGRENMWVVSTLTKLNELEGRPLLMDSNDADLDEAWSGMLPVITGYRDERLYPLGLNTRVVLEQ